MDSAEINESVIVFFNFVPNSIIMNNLRKAERRDVNLILDFIKGIAEYEKLSDQVKATSEVLEEWLFDKNIGQVVFAMEEGKEVGFVLFFYNFSTFVGKGGLYIEDLYVNPEFRGKGHGKALINYVIEKARKENLERVEWTCLDWNTPSIEFYKSLGAVSMDEWTNFRFLCNNKN